MVSPLDDAHDHAADAAGAAGAGGLPQLDYGYWPGVIFWVLLAFAILYFVVARGLLPRLGGAIEDRSDKIADDQDKAGELKRQAEQAEASFEAALADARARAHGIIADNRAQLDTDIAADSAAVDAELAKRNAAAEERIAQATADAMANVESLAVEAAGGVVEKLTGVTPDAAAVSAAVTAQAGRL